MKTLRLTLKRMLTVATVATLALGGALVTTSATNAAEFSESTLSVTSFTKNQATPAMTFDSVKNVSGKFKKVVIGSNLLGMTRATSCTDLSNPSPDLSVCGIADIKVGSTSIKNQATAGPGDASNSINILFSAEVSATGNLIIELASGAFTAGSIFNISTIYVTIDNVGPFVDRFWTTPLNQGFPTISFHPNDGTGSYGPSDATSLSSYDIPMAAFTSFSRDGYTFLGFSTDRYAPTATYTTNAFTITNPTNQTLYAIWKTIAQVTFNGNGATSGTMSPQKSLSGEASLTKNVFERVGFTFMGWATSPTGPVQYMDQANYPFTTSVDLYAVWQANSTPDPTPQPSPGALATFNLAIAPNCAVDVNLVPQNFSLTGGFWALNSPAPPTMYPAGLTVSADGRLQGSISTPVTYTSGQSFKSFPIAYYANGTSPSGPGLGYVIIQATNTAVCPTNGGSNGGNTIPVITPRATAKIQLNLEIGERASNAPLSISSSALQPGAAYNVEVRSTPTVIASGKVSASGTVSQTTNLPTNLEPGWHTIVFTSTAADGTPFVSKAYFEIAADGTLLASSQELAYTGASDNNWLGAIGVMALLAGALLFVVRRRIA